VQVRLVSPSSPGATAFVLGGLIIAHGDPHPHGELSAAPVARSTIEVSGTASLASGTVYVNRNSNGYLTGSGKFIPIRNEIVPPPDPAFSLWGAPFVGSASISGSIYTFPGFTKAI
jgi:hypothetical protein